MGMIASSGSSGRMVRTVRHRTEPGTTMLSRAVIGFLSLLPIKGLL